MNREDKIKCAVSFSILVAVFVAVLCLSHKPRTNPTYQYTITYTVYYPTEAKRVTKTGIIDAPNEYWRPRAKKKVRARGVKIKVDLGGVIYEGKSDAEINSFTYRLLQ